MAHQQSSELLRALGQLDDAALAKKLLPLLRADKSAGAVALACKQLRLLCHGNQRELKLTGANCQHLVDYETGELDPFAIADRFPAASSVEFRVEFPDSDEDEDLSFLPLCDGSEPKLEFRELLPMLARLPNLTSLRLDVISRAAYISDPFVPDLQQLRLQLPQLHSLQLSLLGDWAGDSQQAWAALGAATQLTELVVEFSWDNARAGRRRISLQHLSALQPLSSSLQRLEVKAFGATTSGSPQDCSFLGSFSGLSSLRLPFTSKRAGLAAISSCTALRELWFDFSPIQDRQGSERWPQLDAAECDALAQLTRLTLLDIPPASDTPALLAALRCLPALQVLELLELRSSHLPVLAALTQLTQLRGTWVDEASTEQHTPAAGAVQLACPSVVDVSVLGPFPLAAFPGAKAVAADEPWRPSRLLALSKQMKQLESLTIHARSANSIFSSLDPDAPEPERVAAVRSLGQLPHLTKLQFAVSDDAEAAALAAACTQLKELCLRVPHDGDLVGKGVPYNWHVTAKGLSSLFGRLSKLRTLAVLGYGLRLRQPQATQLLNSLSALPELQELHVSTAKRTRTAAWERAADNAREAGLALPAVCVSSVFPRQPVLAQSVGSW